MSEQKAYAAYQTFMALKQHFSKSTYDYFKYNGRIKSNINSFRMKKDRFQFELLTRKYDESELIDFLVANLIRTPNIWIGELCKNPEHAEHYKEWKKNKQALTYQFTCDILSIKSSMNHLQQVDQDFNQLFASRLNEHPMLLDIYTEGTISLETLIGIDLVLGCFAQWERDLSGDIIWDDLYQLCRQYAPFLRYDVKKRNTFKKILVREFASVI